VFTSFVFFLQIYHHDVPGSSLTMAQTQHVARFDAGDSTLIHLTPHHVDHEDTPRVDELLSDIAITIDALKDIVSAVGTTKDTHFKRQEFTRLRDSVNEKIRRATNRIKRLIENDTLSLSSNVDGDYVDTAKYQEELKQIQRHSHQLRTIVASALKQFQTYTAHSIVAEHDEQSPLLRSAAGSSQRFGSFVKDVTVVTQQQMMEEEEEKISEIHSNIRDLKVMFEDLDDVVNQQGDVVDQLEHNVVVTKEAVGAGEKELETADEQRRRSRCNKIALLIVLLLVLALVLAFVWAYDRSK